MIRTSELTERTRASLSADSLAPILLTDIEQARLSQSAIPILYGFELVSNESTVAGHPQSALEFQLLAAAAELKYEEPI